MWQLSLARRVLLMPESVLPDSAQTEVLLAADVRRPARCIE